MLDTSLYEELTKDLDTLLKARANVGEIREWKGIRYQKQVSGKWIPLRGQKGAKAPKSDNSISFGKNYSQYEEKPKEAIEFLMKERNGQVRNAYERDDLGQIDIIWGDETKGLRHIELRHKEEQNDFSSVKDMAEKISDVLENGKIGKLSNKGNRVSLYKGNYIVFLVKEVVYNEEDDFRDKIWILTSYDTERSIEEKKIQKSSDLHTYPVNSAIKSDTDEVQSNIEFSSESFSDRKITLKKSLEQQFDEFLIQKARISYPIGTIKQFNIGGKMKDYIKTSNGWRPKKKGNNTTEKVDSSEKENNRQKTKENTSEQKNRIKLITQTYVKIAC